MERNDEHRRDRHWYEGRPPERSVRRWEHGEVGEGRTGPPDRADYSPPQDWQREAQGNYGPGRPEDWDERSRGEPWGDRYREDRGWFDPRERRFDRQWSRPPWGGREPWAGEDDRDRGGYMARPTHRYEEDENRWRSRGEPRGSQYGYRVGRGQPGPESERGWPDPSRERERRGYRGGKAPRDYRRADDRIRDDIVELIVRESDLDASDVQVQVVGGEVTLTGSVEDRRAKRELEDLAERVFGVHDIHNNVRVRRSAWRDLSDRLFGVNEGEQPEPVDKNPKS